MYDTTSSDAKWYPVLMKNNFHDFISHEMVFRSTGTKNPSQVKMADMVAINIGVISEGTLLPHVDGFHTAMLCANTHAIKKFPITMMIMFLTNTEVGGF